MMILFENKAACCGCTACEHICPQGAIHMQPDEEGFVYPVINQELCIECGLCKQVCAFQNGYKTPENFDTPLVYGVKHKNEKERQTSRSGGMFIAISDYILERGGVVYGVGYADHFRVVHKRATNKEERDEFKGSKYVQSDLNTTFKQIKHDLNAGLLVLFSGTPCQTAGLSSYLNRSKTKTDQLILCDIVCHGVPSPKVWADYLDYIEKINRDSVVKVDFRDKAFGWVDHKESFILSKGNTKISGNIYTYLFYSHTILRPSCGECKYTNFRRPADITLADFWGIDKIAPEFNADNQGVSLVFVNTPKAKAIFQEVDSQLNYFESTTTDCLQPNLERPSSIPSTRAKFWYDYHSKGFKYVVNRYGSETWRTKLRKSKIGKGIRYSKKILTNFVKP